MPLPFNQVRWRISHGTPPTPTRTPTHLPNLDKLLGGGLPNGLTTIYGEAGCGKSLLAKQIAKRVGEKQGDVLYFACEVLTDAYEHGEPMKGVTPIDFVSKPVPPPAAYREFETFVEELDPKLIVIDSITSFLGFVSPVPERDIRAHVSRLHAYTESRLPVIAISEVRGHGFQQSTAGGEAVKHGCTMLVKMWQKMAREEEEFQRYQCGYGDRVYFLSVEKDKWGVADTGIFRVAYEEGEARFVGGRV